MDRAGRLPRGENRANRGAAEAREGLFGRAYCAHSPKPRRHDHRRGDRGPGKRHGDPGEGLQEVVGRHEKGRQGKPQGGRADETHRTHRPPRFRHHPGAGAPCGFRGGEGHQRHDQGTGSHRGGHRRVRTGYRSPQAAHHGHRRRREKGRPCPTRPGDAAHRRAR